LTQAEVGTLGNRFTALDSVIDAFRNSLAPLPQQAQAMPSDIRTIFVTHTLAHAAVIQLHSAISRSNPRSQEKSLAAARSVIMLARSVNIQVFGQVNPVLNSLWAKACQAIAAEVNKLRELRGTWAPNVSAGGQADGLTEILESGFALMQMFSVDGQLLGGHRPSRR
jgi:hypothetical protein